MTVLALLASTVTLANMEVNNAQFVEYLAKEKVNLTIAINAEKLAIPPANEAQLAEQIVRNGKMR